MLTHSLIKEISFPTMKENHPVCPFCATEITAEVGRALREVGAAQALVCCGGQITGRPPVFTAIENKKKRICFLHPALAPVQLNCAPVSD
jgi:hypothetical protein